MYVTDGLYDVDKTKHKIKLKYTRDYFDYIQSKPLSNIIGQLRSSGDFIEVTFEMCINNELISRLFSYKSNCEVLEPEVLREKMREEVMKMNLKYK